MTKANKYDPKKAWPADKVERKPIDDLIPYARNARTHSDDQVAQIAASMREWGWTNPVLIDEDGGIIAGHGRIMAARQLGLTEVPCMVANGWTEAQKRAYVIADNKLALNAGWDNETLLTELQELSELDFDVSLTGFDEPTDDDEGDESGGVEDETKFILMMELDNERALEREYARAEEMGIPCKIIE